MIFIAQICTKNTIFPSYTESRTSEITISVARIFKRQGIGRYRTEDNEDSSPENKTIRPMGSFSERKENDSKEPSDNKFQVSVAEVEDQDIHQSKSSAWHLLCSN